MWDKGLNLFDECAAAYVHLCALRKNSATLLPEGTVECTDLAPQQIYRGC